MRLACGSRQTRSIDDATPAARTNVHAGKLGKTMTEFAVPSYAVLINKDGIETYTNADDVTEIPEQLNAILVLLTEFVALPPRVPRPQ
jgi:hypothetical protein